MAHPRYIHTLIYKHVTAGFENLDPLEIFFSHDRPLDFSGNQTTSSRFAVISSSPTHFPHSLIFSILMGDPLTPFESSNNSVYPPNPSPVSDLERNRSRSSVILLSGWTSLEFSVGYLADRSYEREKKTRGG